MDLQNQQRVIDAVEKYGADNVVVLLGSADAEGAALHAETVTTGDPTFAGPLAGVSLGLPVYHVLDEAIKAEADPAVWEEQVGMMEMVLDGAGLARAVAQVRDRLVRRNKRDAMIHAGGDSRDGPEFHGGGHMPEMEKETHGEKTVVRGLAFCSIAADSNSVQVECDDGKIIRIRPLHYDWKYPELKPWKMEARGKTFSPSMESLIPPFSLGYKNRVYSPNRVLYPLKRVDWDPNGETEPAEPRHQQVRAHLLG